MSDHSRRYIRLSPARKNIGELMRLSQNIPLVTAERRMDLNFVAEARKASDIKISWTVIFLKAFAIVAARRPELRTCYLTYPYARLYEHPSSVGSVIIERQNKGEYFPISYPFRNPERATLRELHQALEHFRTVPLEDDKQFRKLQRVGRLPRLLCRLMWKLGYHWSGSKRAHYFGTFALSSPASSGAGLTTIVSPLTCTLHYGLFDDANRLDMRLTFDHRVIDGAPVARALAEMEEVLVTDIVAELRRNPLARLAA